MAALVPAEFEAVYVQRGRVDCEAHFKANRAMIDCWLRASGKQRLIDKRAAFVAEQRANGEWMTRSTKLVEHREVKRPTVRETIRDKRQVSFLVARHAAHHLRIMRHGGLIVSPAGDGEWWVGSKRLSAAQMVDLARSRGFDDKVVVDAPLQPDHGGEVKS